MENETAQGAKKTLDRMAYLDLAEYKAALDRLTKVMAERGLSRYDIAQQSGIPSPTLNPWMEGTTKGSYPNTTRKVMAFLQTLADAAPVDPGQSGLCRPDFIETPTSRRIFTALAYAQTTPSMVLGTFGSGMGKTTAAKHFAATRSNVVYVVLSPLTYAPFALQREIAAAGGIERRRGATLLQVIGQQLSEGGKQSLLIIDEAQNLKEKSINVLRHLYDVYGVGLAFLGNEDIFRRLLVTSSREGAGQVQSRFGMRLHELKPTDGDITAYLDAWNVTAPDLREFLAVIGRKAGALRQIGETLQSCLTAMSGSGRALTVDMLRDAWLRRSGELLK